MVERRRPSGRARCRIRPGARLGGQLATLYAGSLPGSVLGLELLAAGSTHVAAWKGWRRIVASGYTSLIRDWGYVGKTGRYEPEGAIVDYETACRRPSMPVLSMGVHGDPFVPPAVRQALVDRLPLAPSHSVEVPRSPGASAFRSHFAWARKPDRVVAVVDQWMATLGDFGTARDQGVAAGGR